jgi:multifunctional methyltransferase subunit TRM112
MKQEKSEFDAEMIVRLLPKLDWKALQKTALALEIAELPDTIPDQPENDIEFLQAVHDLIMDIHIMEGSLVCPHCQRVYPITKGIPNMLLNDDEL